MIGTQITAFCVDGIGVNVYHRQESDLSPENIRRHLIGRRETYVDVAAENEHQAMIVFLRDYESAIAGSFSEKSRALRIDDKKPIIVFPPCDRIYFNCRHEFVCGDPRWGEDDSGEFGGCVLEAFDAPNECPIADFWEFQYVISQKIAVES